MLERIGFFPALERIVKRVTGRTPRPDESVNVRFRQAN